MREFEVGGHHYKSGKLTAFQQLHVVRRLAPVLAGMGDVLKKGMTYLKTDPITAAMPLVEAVSRLSDEDVEFAIYECLGVVQRQQPGNIGWAWVCAPGSRAIMFEDIDMIQMLQITWQVLEDNVMGFSAALQGMLPKVAAPEGQE